MKYKNTSDDEFVFLIGCALAFINVITVFGLFIIEFL